MIIQKRGSVLQSNIKSVNRNPYKTGYLVIFLPIILALFLAGGAITFFCYRRYIDRKRAEREPNIELSEESNI